MSNPRLRTLRLPENTYMVVLDRAEDFHDTANLIGNLTKNDYRCKFVFVFSEEVDLDES